MGVGCWARTQTGQGAQGHGNGKGTTQGRKRQAIPDTRPVFPGRTPTKQDSGQGCKKRLCRPELTQPDNPTHPIQRGSGHQRSPGDWEPGGFSSGRSSSGKDPDACVGAERARANANASRAMIRRP